MSSQLKRATEFALGSKADWHIRRRRFPRLRPALRHLGPLAVLVSVVGSWPAFAGATGEEGQVALGLWVGAASVMLMSWSFILAYRPKVLEPLFGGLDSMYRVHRWAGTLALPLMLLHTSIEPEITGGIRGAGRSLAETAEELAGAGEMMLYILVGVSLLRLLPYRFWRLTHKLLGIPFLFACFHFFTAEKPYANASAWGWWFGFWMVAGLIAFVARVIGRDVVSRGAEYRVVAADHRGTTTRLELEPVGPPLGQELGQFAFLKLDVPGMSEPHPFTIASAPETTNLEFFIRHLGDWSDRLPDVDLIGSRVLVEGPYGTFEPFSHRHKRTLWIAGGVGITPFLAALDRPALVDQPIPTLLYAVRETDNNPIVDRLRLAEALGRVDLHLFSPEVGRLSPADLDRIFPDGLAGTHVALCGPTGLISTMSGAALDRGADRTETEDFDIRQGFGPDRSRHLDRLARRVPAQARAVSTSTG